MAKSGNESKTERATRQQGHERVQPQAAAEGASSSSSRQRERAAGRRGADGTRHGGETAGRDEQ